MINKREGFGLSRRDTLILISILIGSFMTALDVTVVNVALNSISEYFGGGNTAWILIGYTLMVCCFVMLWGKIGTNIGYRSVFIIGTVIFTVISLMIGVTGFISGLSMDVIIVLRFAQGAGAGMIMAMGMAIIGSYIDPKVRGMVLGLTTLAISVGTAAGPVVGGLLAGIHWSLIFFINVPIGIICVIMSRYSMKDVPMPTEKKGLDIMGVALLFGMMFALIMFLHEGPKVGWISGATVIMLATFILCAILIYIWESRTKDPILDIKLISRKNILSMNIVNLLIFGGMAGCFLLMPLYLQKILGFNVVESGLILVTSSVGMLLIGPIIGKISDMTGTNKKYVMIGLLIAGMAFLLMSFLNAGSSLLLIVLSLFLMGVGVSMALLASTNLAFLYVNENESGQLSGMINTFRQAGSSIGVAIMSSIAVGFFMNPATIEGYSVACTLAVAMAILALGVSLVANDRKKKIETEPETIS